MKVAKGGYMDVAELSLRKVLEGSSQYVVPLYQRPYAWRVSNWDTLWNDITDLIEMRAYRADATHFTGTLVLDLDRATAEGTRFLVVDGQQRLTTLSVLLAAIAAEYENQGLKDDAERLRKQVLIHEYEIDPAARYRLRPANFDEAVYRSAVDNRLERSGRSQVDDAFLFFVKKLKSLEDAGTTLSEIEKTVLSGLKFVTITAKADDNVYRIFESINNTGIDLTQADLIRNLLFMQMGTESAAIHERLWLPLQRDLSGEDIENVFWIDAQWRDPNARKLDTYELQKKYILALPNSELVLYLEHALAIADAIRVLRLVTPVSSPHLTKRLHRFDALKQPSLLVLAARIVFLRNEDLITDEQAGDALNVIESYVLRRSIAGLPTAGIGRIAAAAAHELTHDPGPFLHEYLSTGRKGFVTDKEIQRLCVESPAYNRIRRDQLSNLLAWLLELEQGKDELDFSKMTIEHVLPQSLRGNARSEFAQCLTIGEDVEEAHDALVHTLGNLTLTNYNSELSNKPFSVKRSEGLAKTGVVGNREIAANTHWGPAEIEARSRSLGAIICQTWPGPNEELLGAEPTKISDQIDEAVGVIPPGYWTSYGDIAKAVGTASQVVGMRVSRTENLDGAWRVLRSNGSVAPGFHWSGEHGYGEKSAEQVLTEEGLVFTDGIADPMKRLGPLDILHRMGRVEEPNTLA